MALGDVRAICLTHLDSDHFRPAWIRLLARQNGRLFVAKSRVGQLRAQIANYCERFEIDLGSAVDDCMRGFDGNAFEPHDGVRASPIALDHDVLGSHGFVFECAGSRQRVGYATDLGRVPASLIEHFADLDIVALECNYDPEMQLASRRPFFLKQRIMGGAGHLSNRQAFDAIRQLIDRAQRRRHKLPSHIVLLHRSRECNCPKLVRKLFASDPRIMQRLTLAEQFERSEWLRPRPCAPLVGEQLVLQWA